jgi:hypothetical protein
MKKSQLFLMLSVFCTYLGAHEPISTLEKKQSDTINIDLSALTGFDVHQHMKNMMQLMFSQCPQHPSCFETFYDPMVQNHINSLQAEEKASFISRLYTLEIASHILCNPKIDGETSLTEDFRVFLEQMYDLTLPNYPSLSLNNSKQASSAYVLFLVNSIAMFDSMVNFDDYEESLAAMNLASDHSRRMIHTFMSMIPYLAFEEASNLFADNITKLGEIEEISRDFYERKILVQQCADRINNLFK